jgi:hypothetical protein
LSEEQTPQVIVFSGRVPEEEQKDGLLCAQARRSPSRPVELSFSRSPTCIVENTRVASVRAARRKLVKLFRKPKQGTMTFETCTVSSTRRSSAGTYFEGFEMVELVGIEPTTSSLRTMASAKVTHSLACIWLPSTVHYGPIQTMALRGVCLETSLTAQWCACCALP